MPDRAVRASFGRWTDAGRSTKPAWACRSGWQQADRAPGKPTDEWNRTAIVTGSSIKRLWQSNKRSCIRH